MASHKHTYLFRYIQLWIEKKKTDTNLLNPAISNIFSQSLRNPSSNSLNFCAFISFGDQKESKLSGWGLWVKKEKTKRQNWVYFSTLIENFIRKRKKIIFYARKQCDEAWKQIKSNKLLAMKPNAVHWQTEAAYQSTLPANLVQFNTISNIWCLSAISLKNGKFVTNHSSIHDSRDSTFAHPAYNGVVLWW